MLRAVYLRSEFGHQGLTGHTTIPAIVRWFVASRGRAVSLAGLTEQSQQKIAPMSIQVSPIRAMSAALAASPRSTAEA